jgi:hypothetical protein
MLILLLLFFISCNYKNCHKCQSDLCLNFFFYSPTKVFLWATSIWKLISACLLSCNKEWRNVAQDLLCRTTLSWRHIIGIQGKYVDILFSEDIVSIFPATLRSTFLYSPTKVFLWATSIWKLISACLLSCNKQIAYFSQSTAEWEFQLSDLLMIITQSLLREWVQQFIYIVYNVLISYRFLHVFLTYICSFIIKYVVF